MYTCIFFVYAVHEEARDEGEGSTKGMTVKYAADR